MTDNNNNNNKTKKVNGRTVRVVRNARPAVKVTGNSISFNISGSTTGMTPEDAAMYRQYIEKAASRQHQQRQEMVNKKAPPPSPPPQSSTSSPGNGKDEKVTFGPSKPPEMKSVADNPSSAAAMDMAADFAAFMGSMTGSTVMGPFSSSMGDSNSDKPSSKKKKKKTASQNNNRYGIPCSEAEMKALMGVFAEAMGMSTNGKNGKRGNAAKMPFASPDGTLFSFGPNGTLDASMLAAAAAAAAAAASNGSSPMMPDDSMAWEALAQAYASADPDQIPDMGRVVVDDDDDYDDDPNGNTSFENRELTFEEMEFLLRHRKQKEEAEKMAGNRESLEQAEIDDDDDDEKERKAAKNREKKQRRKAKLKEEAEQKAAEEEQKRLEKTCRSWRSRVVSACQSNDVDKLDSLLNESPLGLPSCEDGHVRPLPSYTTSALEFLMPHALPKNRSLVDRGAEGRLKLASFIMDMSIIFAHNPLRTGRSPFHTACFFGDVRFVELFLEKMQRDYPKSLALSFFFRSTCGESGFTPLHYAAVSSSSDIVELLLSKGSDVTILTDDTHTWKKSDGTGLTARELVGMVQSGNPDKFLETHGVALQDISNSFLNNQQERKLFLRRLEWIHSRLESVEKNGYTPPKKDASLDKIEENEIPNIPSEDFPTQEVAPTSKSKKKKKKKKNKNSEEDPVKSSILEGNGGVEEEKSNPVHQKEEDPLITALRGMGFTNGAYVGLFDEVSLGCPFYLCGP
jgi:hypothetical protein